MSNLEVDTEERSGELVIRFSGELDLACFDEVNELLATSLSDGHHSVRIDLRGLQFIDSTGIRLLLAANEQARLNAHQLCIIRGSEQVQRVFALTDLDSRLPFCDDEP